MCSSDLIPADSFAVLTVRRLDPRMGLLGLIDAFARVRTEHPRAVLLIAGRGPQADVLAARARDLMKTSPLASAAEKEKAQLDWQAYFHLRNRFVAALLHSTYPRGGRIIRESLNHQIAHLVSMQYSTAAMRLLALEGFDTATFSFGTDIPLLTNWGTPLLFGPGSIHRAHTSEEFVEIAELRAAVGHYVALAGRLLVR